MNNDIMKGMVPLMGVVMIAGVLQMVIPARAAPEVFTCPYCGAEFASKEGLLAHIRDVHPEVPATFQVSDLVILPSEVDLGQVVTISCIVTNTGGQAGSYTVTLGGDLTARQTVALQSGESRAVSFEAIPREVKVYQVVVDGLSGSFKTKFLLPFTFSDASSRRVVSTGAPVYWTIEYRCTITNPNNAVITEPLDVMYDAKRLSDGKLYLDRYWWTFELTLNPGQAYKFFWNGNAYGHRAPDAYDGPDFATGQTACIYLKDRSGNTSPKVWV